MEFVVIAILAALYMSARHKAARRLKTLEGLIGSETPADDVDALSRQRSAWRVRKLTARFPILSRLFNGSWI